ncbi:hypothetical protein [Candidatus Odyssella acanthamoebae]|nr:hypothetical protein [Candidatus Paracaedibacter acanthamoebae]
MVFVIGNMVTAADRVEIFTDPTKGDSYTVCVSLAIEDSEVSRTKFAKEIQAIYDHHNLKLTYSDDGKFWQLPHLTLVMFEKVKLKNIKAFDGIFEQLKGTKLDFIPESYGFFGRGDQLISMPPSSLTEEAKKLNADILAWVNESLDKSYYRVCRNTLMKNLKPHLSLNTCVNDKNVQGRVRRILGQSLNATVIKLDHVIITSTNEWF